MFFIKIWLRFRYALKRLNVIILNAIPFSINVAMDQERCIYFFYLFFYDLRFKFKTVIF